MITVFINNICSFINNFTPSCRIPKLRYHERSLLCQMFVTCSYPEKAFGTRFWDVFLHSRFRDHLAMLELMPKFQMMPGLRLRFIIPGPLVGASVVSMGFIRAGTSLLSHEVVD